MAPPPGTLRVGRYFLALLALLAVLYVIVFLPGQRHAPKLGLDLVGGQQVIFQAKAPHGQTPSSSAMQQAKQIMEDRVNGSGVTEATVLIQGSDQIVVSIPGGTKTDVQQLGAAAVLNFRGVVAPATPVTCGHKAAGGSSGAGGANSSPSSAPSKAAGRAPNDAGHRPLAAPTAKATPKGGATATSTGAQPSNAAPPASPSGAPTASPTCSLKSVAQLKQAVNLPAPDSVYAAGGVSAALSQSIQAQLTNYDCSQSQTAPDRKNDYYVACEDAATAGGTKLAFLLGPVIVPGSQINSASAQAPNLSGTGGTSKWSVQLTLKGSGSNAWGHYTSNHNIGGSSSSSIPGPSQCGSTGTPCADFVAFTLDGKVISAPVNETAINGQPTSITGGFNQTSATELAQQLKYGALPLSFTSQQAQTVSATLGTSQLKAGLLAGGIGLVLVIIYSLLYYRGLGLVTIASLLVSGALTYAMLVLLGTQIGFTLSLAGIAGFIVAVGITADSFVVFFERLKDEVHEGRSVRVAVPRAWMRARRTILSADTVSFLAAAILYFFAAGDVKGFAFTLGLSTILDLVVVFLFTHPMVSLLSRSRAFGSPVFTGLNSLRGGPVLANEPAPAGRTRRAPRTPRRREQGAPGSVAVLEKDTDVADEPAADHPVEVSDQPAGRPVDQPTERRHTAPEPGTAAERAAARRARLREQRGGNGREQRGGNGREQRGGNGREQRGGNGREQRDGKGNG